MELALSPLTSTSYNTIVTQNRADSKTILKWSLLSSLMPFKYVLITLHLSEGAKVPWGIALLLTSSGDRYPCTL